MPDQYGNPTPQEILQQIVRERDVVLNSARTPAEQRNANLYAIGQAATQGFDPRLVNAQKIQDALSKSLALTRGKDESALDYEIRRGRQMFEDVKSVDPTTAADVSAKLVELETERAQQERLKAADKRTETQFGWQTEDRVQVAKRNRAWDITDGLFYEVDPKTWKTTGETTGLDDPDHQVKVNEVRDRKNILLSADDLRALGANTSAADYKLLGSDLAATKNQIAGVIDNTNVASNLMKTFINAGKAGDNPATYADKIARGLGPIVNTVNESMKAVGMRPAPAVGSPEFAQDVSIFEQELQRRNLQSQVPVSLMVQLAYTWAKSFDNRVTEQDFLNAYNMLGAGTQSPAVIASTIREMTFGRYQSMMDTAGTVVGDLKRFNEDNKDGLGYKQGQSLDDLLGVYKGRIDEFRGLSDELLKMYGGEDRHSPEKPQKPNVLERNGRKFIFQNGGG